MDLRIVDNLDVLNPVLSIDVYSGPPLMQPPLWNGNSGRIIVMAGGGSGCVGYHCIHSNSYSLHYSV